MDKELFELCKEVYERTNWADTGAYFLGRDVIHRVPRQSDLHPPTLTEDDCSPLYTSDYLLEKLPKYLLLPGLAAKEECRFELVPQGFNAKGASAWCAGYLNEQDEIPILEAADTPLQALLKLVLALDDSGVKL